MNNPDADVYLGDSTLLGSGFAMPSSNGYTTSVTFGTRFHSLCLIQRLNINPSSFFGIIVILLVQFLSVSLVLNGLSA